MDGVEKHLSDLNKPIFEQKNWFISEGKIRQSIGKYINRNHYNENTSDINRGFSKSIVQKIKSLTTSTRGDFEVSSDGILKIIVNNKGKKESFSFNLNQKLSDFEENPMMDIYLGNGDLVKQKKQRNRQVFSQNIGKVSRILDGMDYVFEKNEETSWDNWFFDELNESDRVDTLEYGEEIAGLNLTQIQEVYKKYYNQIKDIPKKDLSKEMVLSLVKQEKRYLKMFMGIGDTYEGGASLLEEEDNQLENTIENMVNFSGSNADLLQELADLHEEIDANDYQSTTVEKSYKVTIEILHQEIYNKLLQDKGLRDKDLILFAKVITGRGSDIDDNLRDHELAQQILFTVMQRKGGVIDTLSSAENMNLDDDEILRKNPRSIIINVRKRFYARYGDAGRVHKQFNRKLKESGYEDILDIPADQPYSKLSFYQKTKLSVLHRVAEKMEDGKSSWEMFKEGGGKVLSLENPSVREHYIHEDFSGLFNSVASDYIEETADKLDDKFTRFWGIDGLTSEDMGLEEGSTEAEAFDLFQDIRGAGLFDLSDGVIAGTKTAGKFGATLAVGMGAAVLLSSVIPLAAAGALAGASASLVSMAVNPHGYDKKSEAAIDITSDIAVGAITGYGGGAIAQNFEKQGAKFFTKEFLKNPKFIMATDLAFLGLVPEVIRMKWIDGVYHSKEILKKAVKEFDKI